MNESSYKKLKAKLDKANRKIEENDKIWTIYYTALVTIANSKGPKVVEAPNIASEAIAKGLGVQLIYNTYEKE